MLTAIASIRNWNGLALVTGISHQHTTTCQCRTGTRPMPTASGLLQTDSHSRRYLMDDTSNRPKNAFTVTTVYNKNRLADHEVMGDPSPIMHQFWTGSSQILTAAGQFQTSSGHDGIAGHVQVADPNTYIFKYYTHLKLRLKIDWPWYKVGTQFLAQIFLSIICIWIWWLKYRLASAHGRSPSIDQTH